MQYVLLQKTMNDNYYIFFLHFVVVHLVFYWICYSINNVERETNSFNQEVLKSLVGGGTIKKELLKLNEQETN